MLLLLLAARPSPGIDLPALAWVHLVALGWLTMIALSILVHGIPAFTDVRWKGERIARFALGIFGVGVVALVAAFWSRATWALPWTGTLVMAGLLCYLTPATWTLLAALAGPRVEAAIARALLVTLACLLLAASAGVALAWTLAGRLPAALLVWAPPIHASLGIIGWLTVLVMGVSTRTVRPMTGVRSRLPWVHVVAGSAAIAGTALLMVGFALGAPAIVGTGAVAVCIGAMSYAVDLVDVLRRATVPHRPPQAFVAAAAIWLIVGFSLGAGAVVGAPSGAATIYVLLIGWIGQMVNGHLHHIGIRLIATMARGDDDETQPAELLSSPLSWTAFVLCQAAVAAGAVALFFGIAALLEGAALCGLAAWLAMGANVAIARRRAEQPSRHIFGLR